MGHETVGHRHSAHGLGHLGGQFFLATAVTGGNGEERHDGTVRIGFSNLRQALDKHIDTLVLEFVATTVNDQQGVVRNLSLNQRGGHLQKALAGSLAFAVKLLTLRHEGILETIDGDDIGRSLEECSALAVGNLTHRGVSIRVLGGQRLQRELGLHAKTLSRIERIILLNVSI